MKIVILFALVVMVVAQDGYPTKYDNIDVDEILNSDRHFKNYFNCLMDAGPCTPEGNELKKYLPDAIQTACAKCTDKQRQITAKVAKFLIEQRPEEWKALRTKYDPNNTFAEKYRDEAAKFGIKL
ncbi:AAEL005691-PA [Aedes aegypti]|uniref:AAEL005691-PA n=2 Tax=Aedes aegypti TaxID=7159 RepID=A0A1S4FB91_AEDAE|nr:ejaculatory bulb-specific protein 3 [Aedes aegypti]EAT42816.1 AAEL005691-PA [Aedes aegypti]